MDEVLVCLRSEWWQFFIRTHVVSQWQWMADNNSYNHQSRKLMIHYHLVTRYSCAGRQKCRLPRY